MSSRTQSSTVFSVSLAAAGLGLVALAWKRWSQSTPNTTTTTSNPTSTTDCKAADCNCVKWQRATGEGLTTKLLMQEAKSRGWSVEKITPGGETHYVFTIPDAPHGGKFLYWRSRSPLVSGLGERICVLKHLAYAACEAFDVPSPKLATSHEDESLTRFLAEHKRAVVKPNCGSHGVGVSVDVTTLSDLKAAISRAGAVCRNVIVQTQAVGEDYRVLVVGDKVAAVAKRVPAYVTGDGVSTIRQLIQEKNKVLATTLASMKEKLTQTPAAAAAGAAGAAAGAGGAAAEDSNSASIDLGTAARYLGNEEALARIPAKDEDVRLSKIGNLSQGGESHSITNYHPEIASLAVRITRALGMRICGVDVMTTDITKDPKETGLVVLEINSKPGLRMHVWPAKGPSVNVPSLILDEIAKLQNLQ